MLALSSWWRMDWIDCRMTSNSDTANTDLFEPLPGPYYVDPHDGNARVIQSVAVYDGGSSHPARRMAVTTDIFGGHEATIPLNELLSWQIIEE